ncbi:ATP-binding protein [Undibacterium sp. SXout11W]|uniref:ATP-binding protein n=1 Tax=Undibacterium sp. SXout11W TaxID=3413050 RepID=UPI003BF21698
MITRSYSLQKRLLFLVFALVSVVWIVTAVMTWVDVRDELDDLLDGHLAQAASLLVVQQSREIEGNEEDIDTPTLHRYAPKVAFQVFHEGHLAMRSSNAPATPMAGTLQHFTNGFTSATIDGVAWRVFATRGAENDVQVYVGEQFAARSAILWAVLRSTLWPMIFALPFLGFAIWWAVRRGFAPVRQLGQALAVREPQALHPIKIDDLSSELLPMVDSLNHLFERIGNLLESERRFTADAAHELRTPIAAIRAQAQVALAEANDDLRRHALQNTLEGCDRTTHLVEQLLTLSRLEALSPSSQDKVDLNSLTKEVIAALASAAIRKNQVLEFISAENCLVHGNGTLLAALIRNLLDNAIRYSASSANIQISVRLDEGTVTLIIEDSGQGLSDINIARLGERFFRVVGNGESGSGLGWSIARRIAQVHQLELHVERSKQLGGLAVHIIWKDFQRY